MNGYWFTLAALIIVLGFISWMVHVAMKNAQPVKFSWGEWQDLSQRAKETLINHGYKPPSPPHASFDHPTPHGDQLRSRLRTAQEDRATKAEIRKPRRSADYVDEPHKRGVESLPGVPEPKVFPQGDWSDPENDIRD